MSTSITPVEHAVQEFLSQNPKEIDLSIAESEANRRGFPWWYDQPANKSYYFPTPSEIDIKFMLSVLDYSKIRKNLMKIHNGVWVIVCDNKIWIFGSKYAGTSKSTSTFFFS